MPEVETEHYVYGNWNIIQLKESMGKNQPKKLARGE